MWEIVRLLQLPWGAGSRDLKEVKQGGLVGGLLVSLRVARSGDGPPKDTRLLTARMKAPRRGRQTACVASRFLATTAVRALATTIQVIQQLAVMKMRLKRFCSVLVLVVAALAGTPALAVVTGQYLFENNLLDTSPNARHGTGVASPTFVSPGLYPGSNFALQLNTNGLLMPNQTAGQAVTLPASTPFVTNASGATLTAWVRLDGGTSNRTIIGINNGDTATGGGQGAARSTLQIIDSGGNAQVRALGRRLDSGGSANANSGTTFLTLGQTYFLAGVFDYVNNAIRVYIDGVQVGSSTPGWTAVSANTANLASEIGSVPTANASNQEYWPGLIDGARIFNTALTAEQIMGLYTNPDSVPNPFTPGDTDGNGVVNGDDLTPIRQNYLQAVTMRSQGDLTGDNQVTFADFREWKTAVLGGGGSLDGLDLSFAAVPEPSAILLALLTACGLSLRRVRRATICATVVLAAVATATSARAAVSVTADPAVPASPNVVTVDPTTAATGGNIGLADVRMIRQTFKNPATFNVGTIITGFDVTGGVGGFQISFYEVNDVNAADWASTGVAASPLHTVAFPGNLPGTTNRLQFNLSGPDVFSLPARNAGTQGYAVVFQTVDQVSNPGQFRHTNTATTDTDLYIDGRHYTHTGAAESGGVRDLGLWLLGPDPNLPGPGDVDGLNGVTIADLEIIAANFRKNGGRSQGDLTGDGFIDLFDFRDWKANYPGANSGSGGLAEFETLLGVPEPATAMLALMVVVGGCGLVRRREIFVAKRFRPQALLILGSLAAATLSSSSARAQVDFYFVPAGTANYNLESSWVDPNLGNNFVPSYTFNERATIDNGGTAEVSETGVASPGALTVGSTRAGQAGTGTLRVKNGGQLDVVTGTLTTGAITIGVAGAGIVEVQPGGILTSTGALSTGANDTDLLIVGGAGPATPTATLTVPVAVLNGRSQVFPNANFSTGTSLSFGANGIYTFEASAVGTGRINAGGIATLNGTARLNFTGVTPTVGGPKFTIIEADSFGTSAFRSVTSSASFPANQMLVPVPTDIGGGRQQLRVGLEEVFVLEVNRDTGAVKVTHPGSSAINFDSYSVASAAGSLVPANFNGIKDQGLFGGNWIEATATVNAVGEFKPNLSSAVAGGTQISLGNIYNPFAGGFGGASEEDLQFEFSRFSDGAVIRPTVTYTGTAVNNLLLQVDPSGTGDVLLRNTSQTTVSIDGYHVLSASGRLSTAAWSSLDDQNVGGANVWLENLNNGATKVGEFNQSGFLSLAPGTSLNLGKLYTGGTQDLTFEFLMQGQSTGTAGVVLYQAANVPVPGDFNGNGVVDAADYTRWRDNLGAATEAGINNNGDGGGVTASDFTHWKTRFGNTSGAGSVGLDGAAVPEPAARVLLAMAGVLLNCLRCNRAE